MTFTLITDKKTEKKSEWVYDIWYLVTFKDETEALLDSESKINAINPAFTFQLGLKIWKSNDGTQKIDGNIPKIYEMVISIFSILDKDGRKRFFEMSFLWAEIKPNILLKMLFLTIINVDVNFQAKDL